MNYNTYIFQPSLAATIQHYRPDLPVASSNSLIPLNPVPDFFDGTKLQI